MNIFYNALSKAIIIHRKEKYYLTLPIIYVSKTAKLCLDITMAVIGE